MKRWIVYALLVVGAFACGAAAMQAAHLGFWAWFLGALVLGALIQTVGEKLLGELEQ